MASPRQNEGSDRAGPRVGSPIRDSTRDPARGRSGLDGPIIRHGPLAAGVGLGLLVASAPLPFGAVEPEAVAALRLAAALLLILAIPAAVAGSGGSPGGGRTPLAPVAVPALALLAFTALGLVQAMPWPPAIAEVLSPGHAAAWSQTAEILAAVDEEAGSADTGPKAPAWPRLSLDPGASRSAAIDAAALAALLLTAALVGRSRLRRRWLAACLLAGALFQVLYGVRQLLAGSLEVWGQPMLGVADRLRGTYVNPNHVSYFLEIALAVAFAGVWWAVRKARREPNLERRLLLVLPVLVTWLVLLSGLVLTRSRAGLAAVLVATTVQGVLVAVPRRRWKTAPAGLAAALVGLGIVAAIGAQQGFSRVAGTSLADVALSARMAVARLSLELWVRFPLTGSGLGTFADAFTAVAPAEVAGSTWRHAHNAYAELAATGGLLALIAAAVGLVALVRRLQRVLLKGRRSEDRAAALAALGALASVAVHEAFDFGLTLPANAFALVAVCGAAAGARTLHRRQRDDAAGAEAAPGGGDLDKV